jgi:hypothetical protein
MAKSLKVAKREIKLRNVPPNIWEKICTVQSAVKIAKGTGSFGMDSAVYKMLRECLNLPE